MAVADDPREARKQRIAANLQTAMDARDVSKISLAKLTGLDRRAIQRWCGALAVPSTESLSALEDFFAVPVGWFEADHAPNGGGPDGSNYP